MSLRRLRIDRRSSAHKLDWPSQPPTNLEGSLHDWSGTNKRAPIRTPQSSGLTAVIHQTPDRCHCFYIVKHLFQGKYLSNSAGLSSHTLLPGTRIDRAVLRSPNQEPLVRTRLLVPRNPALLFVLNSAATIQPVPQLIIWDEIASVKQGRRIRKGSPNQQNPRETKQTKNRIIIIVHHERSNCYGPFSGSLR